MDSGRSASYTYNALHRLSTAATTGSTGYPAWGLSWTYDRYGNRSAQTVTAGTGMPSNSVTIDAVHNRVSGSPYAYDASGNMTNDGQNTLTYDGENHAATSVNGSNSGTYVTTTTVYMFSGSQVIAEYDNGAAVAAPSREYIYSGGQRIATIQGSTTTYQHSDRLSVRILTDASSNIVGQRGHYPYGESWYETGTLTKVKFTTYERDSESGNDYAMDRTYVSRLGRFSAVDPLSGSTSDPQSLNRYSYTLNDPINLVDPSGDSSISDSVSCTSSAAASSCSGYGVGPGPGYGANLGAPGVGTSHAREDEAAYVQRVMAAFFSPPTGLDWRWITQGPNAGSMINIITEEIWNPFRGDLLGPGTPLTLAPSSGQAPGGNTSGASNQSTKSAQNTCQQNRILKAIPGAILTGINGNQGGHFQVGISTNAGDLATAGFSLANNIFGGPNGYRSHSFFFSVHVNGLNGTQLSASSSLDSVQGHTDIFNPTRGPLGILRHGIVDLGVGTIFFNRSPALDPRCN